MSDSGPAFRELPSVDAVLRTAEARALAADHRPEFLAAEARGLIEGWRRALETGELDAEGLRALRERAGAALRERVAAALRPSLVPVVNATGVVLHTNLGRAPWPERVAARALAIARGYSNLEYDLGQGERGLRESHLGAARELWGAEAVLVVNNNAAAVILVLSALASGRETIVSRGELVEIGGSFRVPDILAQSGSILREVGTTNRTRLADYEAAIGERTALLMKIHPSNYRVLGFSEAVAIGDLAGLGRRRGLPVVEDLGSGAAVGLEPAGVTGEPTVASSLAAGVDLVTFSGDKLLGGPQAGFILGRRDLVARLKAHPLYRALRPDKVVLAALDELLAIYRARDPWREVPALRTLARSAGEIETRARSLAAALGPLGYQASVVTGASTVGGGAAPLAAIPGPLIAVTGPGLSAARLAEALRRHSPPVIVRVEDDRVLIDLRTVAPDEEPQVLAALAAAIA